MWLTQRLQVERQTSRTHEECIRQLRDKETKERIAHVMCERANEEAFARERAAWRTQVACACVCVCVCVCVWERS